MSNILDITPAQPAVTPAVAAKVYDLSYICKFLTEGHPPGPSRVYAELWPYRRLTQDIQVEVTAAQPILDAEGQPVLDAEGMPTYTPAVVETRTVPAGGEVKMDAKPEEIITLNEPDITPMLAVDPAMEALIEQTIGGFMMQGGNIMALAMSAVLIGTKARLIQKGQLPG